MDLALPEADQAPAPLEPRDPLPPPPARPPRVRPPRWGRWLGGAVAALLLLLVGLVVLLRVALTTDAGHAGIERALNGLEIGPVGKLRVEGLDGDPLGVFTVRRLAVADANGVWLDAHGLAVRWSPLELLTLRRVHLHALHAEELLISRRPLVVARPPKPASKPPLGFLLDDLKLRLRTLPAFSGAEGDWDVAGRLRYARSGAAKTHLTVDSRLHRGDGLRLDADFGRKGELAISADATEAAGGAIAGTLGLPATKPFRLAARAKGDADAGRFELHSRLGEDSPAEIAGTWSPKGGRLQGQVTLAASRVLAPYVERIGPAIRFVVDAGPVDRAGLSQFDARLEGAYGRAHAVGPVRGSDRSTPGLSLELTVTDLRHWHHLATVGPTRALGTFKGRLDDFTYAGRIAGDQLLVTSDYVIGHAEGPASVSFHDHVVKVSGDLQGARAAGKGLMLTLLGDRPHVQLDLDVPPHKPFFFRSLHATGANLKVDATGGSTLFGGLSFKGSGTILSLAGARPGAAGGLDATWSAGLPKGGQTWALDFDAKGRGLKSGLAEADRLLGPTPRLTGKGGYGQGALALSAFDLVGANAHAAGTLGLGSKGELSSDFDWQAKGPFTAGPVQVAGEVRGKGKFTGALSKPEADLSADIASLDLDKLVIAPAHLTLAFASGPAGVEGRATLDGKSEWGEATAKTAFRFAEGGLALSEMVADAGGVHLDGALALRDGAPSTADLNVKLLRGAFLSAGTLSGSLKLAARPGGGTTVKALLEGRDVSPAGSTLAVHALTLRADGPLSKLPFHVSVEAPLPTPYAFAGDGTYAAQDSVTTVTLSGAGKLRKAEFKTLQPAMIRIGPDAKSLTLALAGAGGRLQAQARQAGGAVTGQAKLEGIAMGALNEDFDGVVDATLSLQGQGPRLEGRLDAQVKGARAKDAPASLGLDSTLGAILSGNRIKLDAQATNGQGLKSRVNLDLPAEAAADPFRIAVDRTKAVRGAFSADGELKPLWDLLVGGDRTLAGRLVTQGTVAGTLNDLQIAGDASVAKGRFQDAPTGLVLQDLEAQARFANNTVDVTRFAGADGKGGTVSGQGQVSLQRDGGSSFQLKLAKFKLTDNALAKATASGAVTVVRDAQGHAKLSGALAIDRADITAKPPQPTGVVPLEVREINVPVKPGQAEAPAKRSGPLQVALDVSLKAPRGIFIRGRGLDAELSLDAHVGGSTSKPELTGTARVVRGSYDFSGKRFDFDEAGQVRLGSTPETIRLDLSARRDDPALTATVKITGTASKPQIVLSSIPVLPQDEILSRVLFGVSASQLSGFQAAQLAAAVAGLAGGGGFDVMGNLRQFARLDRLAIGGDAAGATVTGGKYVTDNVYLELTGAGNTRTTTLIDPGRTGSSASVEWRIRKNLSIVSQAWTGGDTRLSVRFRKDY